MKTIIKNERERICWKWRIVVVDEAQFMNTIVLARSLGPGIFECSTHLLVYSETVWFRLIFAWLMATLIIN